MFQITNIKRMNAIRNANANIYLVITYTIATILLCGFALDFYIIMFVIFFELIPRFLNIREIQKIILATNVIYYANIYYL